MKKKITFLLILSMVLSASLPLATYGQDLMAKKPAFKVELGKESPSKVYLEEGNYERQLEEDNVVISLDEKDVIDAIAQLKKEVGQEDGPLKLVVSLPDEEGFNIDFVLTGRAMNAIKKDKVNFKVEGARASIIIPSGGLGETNFKDRELVKLRIDELDNKQAVDKVRDQDAMKMALDIYIERYDEARVRRIKDLLKPLEFELDIEGLGDGDVLAFYGIDDGMDFISGKVRNQKMKYRINHLGQYALVETYFTFTDTRRHWAREEIKSMTAKNVVNGVGNDRFKPDENVTRAEFAKMIVSSLEVDLETYKDDFKDVNKSDWAAPYVATAHKLGIIKGKTRDSFKPDDEITREEMAAMLSRLDKGELSDQQVLDELGKYADGDKISSWARPYVAKSARMGIMKGKKIGFDPKAQATRAEAATTMYRIYHKY